MKDASEKRIGALEDRERSLTLLLSEGRIPKLDLLRLQTQLSQARHDHIVIEQAEKDALSLLGTLTGNEFPIGSVAAIPFDARPDEWIKLKKATSLRAAMLSKNPLFHGSLLCQIRSYQGRNHASDILFRQG
jgi:outer membrane protein TolC